MSDLADALVAESEGCELKAYKDSLGFWTIGYGHLLPQDQDWTDATITQDQAQEWLDQDLNHARTLATGFPHYPDLNPVRQAVLISMCFQMGNKPLEWPNFNTCLEALDFSGASLAGLDSTWAKQTPQRAEREMRMLASGDWVGHEG